RRVGSWSEAAGAGGSQRSTTSLTICHGRWWVPETGTLAANRPAGTRTRRVWRELQAMTAGGGVEGGVSEIELLDVHDLEASAGDVRRAGEVHHALRQ